MIAQQDIGRFWDKHAEGYEKSAISDIAAYEHTLDRTRSYLSPEDRVLELGSGTGSTALALADRVASYTASDISAKMTEIGMRKARAQGVDNLELVAADLFSPQFAAQSYDCVLAFNLLHLVPNVEEALTRIHELVKPGGLFISKTICAPEGFSMKMMAWKIALPIMQRIGKAPFCRFDPVPTWDHRVSSTGFSLLERSNHPVNPPRRYLVARREEA